MAYRVRAQAHKNKNETIGQGRQQRAGLRREQSVECSVYFFIAWLLHKARNSTTTLIPILGPRTREQLDGTLGALDVKLTDAQLARLDETSAVSLGTPHEQIKGSWASIAGGGKPELLEMPVIPVS